MRCIGNTTLKLIWSAVCLCALIETIELPSEANEPIVACVNGSALYKTELDGALRSELTKFQRRLLFDPWQSSSYEALEERRRTIEDARKKNVPMMPSDVARYKEIFSQKALQMGSPTNTYDLNLYAEENALLLSFFQQTLQGSVQDKLIERILVLQEAQNRHLVVSDLEVEQRLSQLKFKYNSDAAFREFLRRNSTSELELRASLEEAILTDKLKAALASAGDAYQKEELYLITDSNQPFESWLKRYKENSLIRFAEVGSYLSSCSPPQINPQTPKANDQNIVKYTVQLPPLGELNTNDPPSKQPIERMKKFLHASKDKMSLKENSQKNSSNQSTKEGLKRFFPFKHP